MFADIGDLEKEGFSVEHGEDVEEEVVDGGDGDDEDETDEEGDEDDEDDEDDEFIPECGVAESMS